MYLNTKYLVGAGFLAGVWIIIYSLVLDISFLLENPTSSYMLLLLSLAMRNDPLPLILIGLAIMIVGTYFYILLFTKERIRGVNLEFEASPDLKTFRVVRDRTPKNQIKKEIPSMAYCSTCGREVHKPFRCAACGQLLCANHILAGDHQCKEGS
ncbi:MAG: AN1-type zinc finger domain-containing protein [Candidatus Hodarchaeales archaeon]|jgi:hypothetical protein